MTQNPSQLRDRFAKVLIKDMFQVKKKETVAITIDEGSYPDIAEALFQEVLACGGKPLIIKVPQAEGDGEIGMKVWPAEALTTMLCNANVWIDMGSAVMLYSSIWEEALDKNTKLRYLVLGNSSIASLTRIFTGYKVASLSKLLNAVLALVKETAEIRITSENGTDVRYFTEPKFAFDIDDGDYSKPIFGTAPGYVNIVPMLGSMNGRIVFDALINPEVLGKEDTIEFIMKDGKITEIIGNEKATKFQAFLAAFDDPNMYKISHNMIGLNPSIRSLSGELVEDERIWGGVDFGFGHTSPIDMPPHGQAAKSHFDGVIEKATIYLDEVKIVEHGEICHPDLIPLAQQLLHPTH